MDTKWTSGNELKYLKEVLENTDEVKKNPFTNRLEDAFCEKYNTKYAIAVNSGTSGLHAALVAAGVKSGDEVITTPFTVLVDSSVPVIMEAIPVFADIEPVMEILEFMGTESSRAICQPLLEDAA